MSTREAKKHFSYPPDFLAEPDKDYTRPYPCGVCGREFESRRLLATHPHPTKKKETRR